MKTQAYQIKETAPGYYAVVEIPDSRETKRQVAEYLRKVAEKDPGAYRIN